VLLSVAALSLSAGCSDSGLKLGRVSGKVTYKGQPVQGGIVSFMPDESKGTIGPPASGAIGSDGSYTMSTNSSGDGALVGYHKVGIVGLDPKPVNPGAAVDPETNPEGYMEAKAKSAAAARSGAIRKQDDFFSDRAGQKYRYVVPKKFGNPEESGIIAKVDRGTNTLNIAIEENGTARINP
jgi:hypothetical protein